LLSAVTNAAEAGSDVVSGDGQHVDAAIVNTAVQDGPPFEAGIDDGGDAEEFPEDKAVEKNGVGTAEDRGDKEDTDENKSDNCLDKEDCDSRPLGSTISSVRSLSTKSTVRRPIFGLRINGSGTNTATLATSTISARTSGLRNSKSA
jgi:hypothetical protein